jgi:hypothetical protein
MTLRRLSIVMFALAAFSCAGGDDSGGEGAEPKVCGSTMIFTGDGCTQEDEVCMWSEGIDGGGGSTPTTTCVCHDQHWQCSEAYAR